MHGIGFEFPLNYWFERPEASVALTSGGGIKVPKTKIASDFIEKTLFDSNGFEPFKPTHKLIWLGVKPKIDYFTKSKKGEIFEMAKLQFHLRKDVFEINIEKNKGKFLVEILQEISVKNKKVCTADEIKVKYEKADLENFELFFFNKPVNQLFEKGLLIV